MDGGRSLRGVLTALLAGAILACGGGDHSRDAGAGGEGRGGTVVLGLRGGVDSLNPYLSTQATTRDVAFQVFASLLDENPDFSQGPPSFRPSLASSWEFSADGRDLTFHLRPDARWSDGVPITAEDVRFTWQAAVDPDVAWLSADSKRFIDDVAVVDPHTVRVRFSRVYPYQLMDANDTVILPRHVWSRVPFKDWRSSGLDRTPVCSGPFKVASWVPNQSIELVRNETFFDPARPRLDRVIFRFLPDAAAGTAQFLAGEIDFWDRLDPRDADRARSSSGVTVARYPDPLYGFIAWNCGRASFKEAAVRRALTLAINRDRIAADVFLGTAAAASGPLPPMFWAHDPTLAPEPHDPGASRALLRAAGWADRDGDGWLDRNGAPFRFNLEVNAETPFRQDIALMVQEDLKAIGIDARPAVLEWSTFNARHRARDFDAFIMSWRLPTKIDLSTTFSTRAIENGHNYGSCSSPELDDVLERAESLSEWRPGKPLFAQALRILQREQPYTFLYWQDRLVGFNRRLRGVAPDALSPLSGLDLWWAPAATGR
jgi:peptide/nickel transport system substrate-binding protein